MRMYWEERIHGSVKVDLSCWGVDGYHVIAVAYADNISHIMHVFSMRLSCMA